ncbi:hypothetical protein BHM03_00040627 [Ensete ventricosum]|nr:hypothetical protein BHM03_00040627 [Ensete ventricosum]
MLSVWPKSARPRTHLATKESLVTAGCGETASAQGLRRSHLPVKIALVGRVPRGRPLAGKGSDCLRRGWPPLRQQRWYLYRRCRKGDVALAIASVTQDDGRQRDAMAACKGD